MRRVRNALMLGLLIGLLSLGLYVSPLGIEFERSVGLPWLFGIRGPLPEPPNVAVIGINGETGTSLGLPRVPRDWPRSVHAELIDALMARGAEVIVFDIHFATEKDERGDARLTEAIERADRVVLFERLTGRNRPIENTSGAIIGQYWAESLVPPNERFAGVAKGLGIFPLPKIDASVYEFWTFKESVGFEPSMPAIATQLQLMGELASWYPGLGANAPAVDLSDLESWGAREWRAFMRATRQALFTTPVAQSDHSVLTRLYSGSEQRILNFYGPPGSIKHFPFQSIINQARNATSTPTKDLTGHTVYVGYSDLYDPGQLDRFYTVFTRDDGVDLAGVEIAATAHANLMLDEALKPLPLDAALLLILTLALTGTMIVYFLPAAWGVPLFIALTVAYGVVASVLFSQAFWLPTAVPLLIQAPLSLFAGLFTQYQMERRRGQRISEAMNYYLPENIAQEFTSGRLDHDASNKVVYGACFATDMSGFSSLAEHLGPDELAKFLNAYFESLAGPLKENNVDVTEFRADAIMCAWTSEQEDLIPRARAVQAALQAKTTLSQFLAANNMTHSEVRIGIEVGWVYVGHAGGGGHFVYSIVGDSANTASRLESLNKHLNTNILTSESVVNGMDGIAVRQLGSFRLKGKQEPLELVEILCTDNDLRAEQRELIDLTESAVAAFKRGEQDKAEADFSHILQKFPEDGPARFYHQLCLTGLPADGVVNMSEK